MECVLVIWNHGNFSHPSACLTDDTYIFFFSIVLAGWLCFAPSSIMKWHSYLVQFELCMYYTPLLHFLFMAVNYNHKQGVTNKNPRTAFCFSGFCSLNGHRCHSRNLLLLSHATVSPLIIIICSKLCFWLHLFWLLIYSVLLRHRASLCVGFVTQSPLVLWQ